jgi:hypothetical protein
MRTQLLTSAALVSAVLAPLAAAQDVLATYGNSKLQFREADMTARGVFEIPSGNAPQALAYSGNAVFYEIEGFSGNGVPDKLARIDARAATHTIVGNTGHDWDGKGLDVDPTTGLMYVFAADVNSFGFSTLYRIDPATAIVTTIAQCPTNLRGQSFAIDAQGRAFAVTFYGPSPQLPPHARMYQIDLATAQATLVVDFSTVTFTNGYQVRDAAFRANGEYWLVTESEVWSLDPSTQTGNVVTSTWIIDTLAFAPASDVGLAYPPGCNALVPHCPCNNANSGGNGCPNSLTYSGGNLRAFGVASLSNDTLQLAAVNLPVGTALFFQGPSIHVATPFGDGKLCIGNPRRLVLGATVNGSFAYPMSGQTSLHTLGLITTPSTIHYQTQYRDNSSFCTPSRFNTTNSVSVTWTP